MYAVNIESFGNAGLRVPCGNNGLQKLHNKTVRGWMKETQIMRKNGGSVYVIKDYTQKMCEMNNAQLVDYILKNYICQLK